MAEEAAEAAAGRGEGLRGGAVGRQDGADATEVEEVEEVEDVTAMPALSEVITASSIAGVAADVACGPTDAAGRRVETAVPSVRACSSGASATAGALPFDARSLWLATAAVGVLVVVLVVARRGGRGTSG